MGKSKDLSSNLDKLLKPTDSKFSASNKINVDDSLEKHVFNEPKNVILLMSWSQHEVHGRFLVDELLP